MEAAPMLPGFAGERTLTIGNLREGRNLLALPPTAGELERGRRRAERKPNPYPGPAFAFRTNMTQTRRPAAET